MEEILGGQCVVSAQDLGLLFPGFGGAFGLHLHASACIVGTPEVGCAQSNFECIRHSRCDSTFCGLRNHRIIEHNHFCSIAHGSNVGCDGQLQ
jgi:hypothetical protein